MNQHVFVETNWVFDSCAPAHHRNAAAVELTARAARGEVRLHLPEICLAEGLEAIRRKCQPRVPEELREFRRWAADEGRMEAEMSRQVVDFFVQYERLLRAELGQVETRVNALRSQPGVEVFSVAGTAIMRAFALQTAVPGEKQAIDRIVLAAILERAAELRAAGADDLAFCELDGHLRPWGPDDEEERREPLASLYDTAGIWVYGDFRLSWPERPPGWSGSRQSG